MSRTILLAPLVASLALAGCYDSELNGADVDGLSTVDDTAFVRFRTADDYWVGLVVMSNTGKELYCPDFESADWIRLVMEADTMIIQLYEEDAKEWVGPFGEDDARDSIRFASGVVWSDELVGEDGREVAFTREEALDPCLGHRFSGANADAVRPYDHDVEAEFTWWSEGIDLRGVFAGSKAAGFIRAVDCGPLDVDFEVEDRIEEYAEGC